MACKAVTPGSGLAITERSISARAARKGRLASDGGIAYTPADCLRRGTQVRFQGRYRHWNLASYLNT
jgi:hypothetical protein